ncbi:50S ribosomal protein L4 [Hymenobacter tibetensis]|jgi:large subunit ribosomal protein L4|uniref:Large ribosomal subunit protein uL4 n=3 Tax=Hymenobacter TaxID=89966 RepID=A0A939ETT8_9BACT|nr:MULTISPECIES: 50S ribosomal protein L4 [Hymenobacter]MBW3373178.1 50S ribosomal protein L4 [Hymenobacter norwichensis]MBO0357151.1 50S ribosomal protein L4 [Hymenobacter telluris]MDF7813109.1 50S ribosomal protein L4 [Hymenobacter sp. YC55]UOG74291.1 50S ribosomal protein L4 [Hymenobacter tibetensis]UOQ65672.1 50S ribosomal protein L4 [Hymenobacter volaticus]
MELSVYNIKGEDTGRKVTLPEAVFGLEPNEHVMYLDVKQYLANQRQGTHKSKQRNEVHGTTKKLKKQKGTGGARAGSMKSPVFIGGGRVFGPEPRDYGFKLNKKTKRLARLSALSSLAKDGKVALVENITLSAPKTKDFLSILNGLKLNNGKKTLLVTGEVDKNVVLSARNIQRVTVATPVALNTHDLLNTDTLLLSEDGLKSLEQLYTVAE